MKNIMRQDRVVASATNTPSNVGVGRNLASLGSLATKTRSLLVGAVVAFAIAGCGGGGGGGSDSGGSSPAVNQAPTDITLSNSAIAENSPINTFVGTITGTDPENDTMTYSFGGGVDDTSFTLDENNLSINISPDYETKSSYSIDITADDGEKNFTKTLTITITDKNEQPTNISLTKNNIDENVPDGTTVATLTTTDVDIADSFTYSFDSGADDSSFSISGDKLSIKSSPNFEPKSTYNIKLKATDSGGLTTTKSFTITINDINEAPTDISLSNDTIDENVPDGMTVGTLSANDQDSGDSLSYSLDGSGTDDNSFTITNNILTINSSPNFEFNPSYSIKLKATDTGGLSTTKDFVITIGDILEPFIMKVKTDNEGLSGDNEFNIPTKSDLTYSYDIDCDYDGTFDAIATGQTGDYTCSYGEVGEYTVAIAGDFPSIYFYANANESDSKKLLEIQAWGEIKWESMLSSFYLALNMQLTAKDNPDLRNVTSMRRMFQLAKIFNQDISDWDVSNVTNMSGMFEGAYAFNQDISKWNILNVTNMSSMFSGAKAFNQDISKWDVSNVTNMGAMFWAAFAFNQDIGDWNVSNVTSMRYMFYRADAFNQDIGDWDVSNVTDMEHMFELAQLFIQDISDWNVSKVTSHNYFDVSTSVSWTADNKPSFP